MSKVLRNKMEVEEAKLFSLVRNQDISDLIESLKPSRTICLTLEGIFNELRSLFSGSGLQKGGHWVWIVGGFPRGHFTEGTKSTADDLIAISKYTLAAQVVTSRISYEIEEFSLGL